MMNPIQKEVIDFKRIKKRSENFLRAERREHEEYFRKCEKLGKGLKRHKKQ